ncbi:MAG: MFS transporter [Coriobacteriales bacterium]|nr:MFS transporter [Coriobacteriales bacterium]
MEQRGTYQNFLVVSMAVMAVAVSVTMVQYKVPTIIPGIVASGVMDVRQTTFLMPAFTFVGIFLALPAGLLVHRIGAKNALLASVGIVAAASLGIMSENVAVLYACRVFEGMALTLLIVSGPVVVQHKIAPDRRGVATGLWIVGGMLGAFLAGVLTPTVFELGGLLGVWLGYAALTMAAGMALFLVVDDRRGEPDRATVPGRAPGGGTPPADRASPVARTPPAAYRLLLTRNMLLFFASFVVFQILLLTTLTFSPTYLQQNDFSPTLSGLVSTLPMLLSIVTSVAFGIIADRTGRYKLLYLVGLIAMALAVFCMFTSTGTTLWLGVALMGLLGMGAPTVAVAVYPRLIGDPAMLAVGMGLLTVIQSIGQFLGTMLPALVLGPALDQWAMMASVVFGISAFGISFAILCRIK